MVEWIESSIQVLLLRAFWWLPSTRKCMHFVGVPFLMSNKKSPMPSHRFIISFHWIHCYCQCWLFYGTLHCLLECCSWVSNAMFDVAINLNMMMIFEQSIDRIPNDWNSMKTPDMCVNMHNNFRRWFAACHSVALRGIFLFVSSLFSAFHCA